MQDKKLTPRSRYNSFGYALKGLLSLIRQEPNMQIHAAVAIMVIIAGIIRHLSALQWVAISIAIGLVLVCEAFNTGIEMLCDLYTKEYNQSVKMIKDIAAAGVLIASIVSVVIGIFVFLF